MNAAVERVPRRPTLTWARQVLEDDPRGTAKVARLRYVEDDEPGLARQVRGRGFSYVDVDGTIVTDPKARDRIAALVIPPAWTEVWICKDDRGHIQATGRDERGRKQYLYHSRWREARDAEKFDRMIAFAVLLPKIRQRVEEDLALDGLPRERVLAAVVRMLETTRIRVGNDEYARTNQSYGITTLRKRHVVDCSDDEVVLDFEGKHGHAFHVEVEDPEVIEVVASCLETPGWEVFKYFDEQGEKRHVTSDDVNAYLRDAANAHVTAKDFRTWSGTVLAAVEIAHLCRDEAAIAADKRLIQAIDAVAGALGNTRAVCRSAYIHPSVLDMDDDTAAALLQRLESKTPAKSGLRPDESAVLDHLRRCAAANA